MICTARIGGILAAFAVVLIAPAHAGDQEDAKPDGNCIENIAGRMVCGTDADAVRARLRIEERLKREGKDPYGDLQLYSTKRAVEPTAISASGALSADEMDTRQDPAPPQFERKPRRSIYENFGQAVFLRGGYVFSAHGAGQNGSISAPLIGAGLIRPIRRWGDHLVNIELEVVYFGDSDNSLLLGAPVESSIWSVTALATLRYRYLTGALLDPYLSIGLGPAYYRGAVTAGGVTISDGEFVLGYSGRAGLIATLSDQLSLEAGYRYLGASRAGSIGVHAGEVGLNLGF